MPTEVILPKVDMDMATGQISRWFHKEGDAVRKGEPLFEIETDKAAMEVDAPASGTLRNVTGAEGVDIAVGAPVAWIYAEGENVTDAAPAGTPATPEADADAARPAKGEADGPAGAPADPAPSAPLAPAADTAERRGVRATPLARRLAREHGLDLAALTGTGPCGRIGREDVERAAATGAPAAPAPRTLGSAPEPARRPAAEAGDAPLAVVRLREGEGTPIVLLHGFGSESASWRPLLAEFEGERPILGIDLPAHGGSVDREAAGFEALVADVEDTIAALGLASLHFAGHSLGGAVAARVASGTSVSVRSLMLVAPAGFGPDIDTAFAEGFARATEDAPIRAWMRHLVADPSSISDSFLRAAVRGRADGRHSRAQIRLAPTLFSNGTQHFEVRSALRDLAMPVKIVAGAEDRVVPPRHFAGLPGTIALHLFPATGHMPQLERRAEMARLLRELTR